MARPVSNGNSKYKTQSVAGLLCCGYFRRWLVEPVPLGPRAWQTLLGLCPVAGRGPGTMGSRGSRSVLVTLYVDLCKWPMSLPWGTAEWLAASFKVPQTPF